jgi:non-ribosomal peptide synthetase component E (peptide arylation enzyme)
VTIYDSPYNDVLVPREALTAVAMRHAARLANKAAFIDGLSGRTINYGNLLGAAQAIACHLACRGRRDHGKSAGFRR